MLSIPWHLLSFWDLIVDLISASVGIASLTLILSGGKIWGKRWGFSISGWHSTFRTSKCLAKCSFNFEESIRSFFDLFSELWSRANLNSSSTSRDSLAVLIAAAFLRKYSFFILSLYCFNCLFSASLSILFLQELRD